MHLQWWKHYQLFRSFGTSKRRETSHQRRSADYTFKKKSHFSLKVPLLSSLYYWCHCCFVISRKHPGLDISAKLQKQVAEQQIHTKEDMSIIHLVIPLVSRIFHFEEIGVNRINPRMETSCFSLTGKHNSIRLWLTTWQRKVHSAANSKWNCVREWRYNTRENICYGLPIMNSKLWNPGDLLGNNYVKTTFVTTD